MHYKKKQHSIHCSTLTKEMLQRHWGPVRRVRPMVAKSVVPVC